MSTTIDRPEHPYLDDIPTTGGPLAWLALLPLEIDWIIGEEGPWPDPDDSFVVGFEPTMHGGLWTIEIIPPCQWCSGDGCQSCGYTGDGDTHEPGCDCIGCES